MAEGHTLPLHGFQVRHKIDQVSSKIIGEYKDDVGFPFIMVLGVPGKRFGYKKKGQEITF
jgi:hypothetical protein